MLTISHMAFKQEGGSNEQNTSCSLGYLPSPLNPKHPNERWTRTATQYRTLVVLRPLNLFASQGHEVKRGSQAWRETQVFYFLSSCQLVFVVICVVTFFNFLDVITVIYSSWFPSPQLDKNLKLTRTSGHFPSPQLDENLNLTKTSTW